MSVGVALVVASCAGGSGDGDSATTTVVQDTESSPSILPPIDRTPLPAGTSAADRVAAAREAAGGDTVETALLDFAAHFGALPGVEPIERDGSIGASPTHVFETILEFRDELTPEQTVAVEAVLDAFFTEVKYRDADATAATSTPVPSVEGLRRSRLGTPFPFSDDLWATPEERTAWRDAVVAAERPLAAVLGLDRLDMSYTVRLAALGPVHHEYEAATLIGVDTDGRPTCEIWIAEARRRGGGPIQVSALAHELFHCWFAFHVGERAYKATPMWLREGLTTWAGDASAGEVTGFVGSVFWPQYLGPRPSWSLYSSSYPAVGFWTTVDELTPIGPMLPDYLSATVFRSNDERLAPVLSWVGADGVASIASAAQQLGVAGWSIAAAVPEIGRVAETSVVDDETFIEVGAGVQFNQRQQFASTDGDEGVLVAVGLSGSGRARWSDGTEIVNPSGSIEELFCLGGSCVCPDGSELPFAATAIAEAGATLDLAIMGTPQMSAAAETRVVDPDDVCEDDPCTEVGPDTPADEVPDECDVPLAEGTECFHGRFRAEQAQAEAYLTQSYADATLGVSEYQAGEVYITLRPDGSYVQELAGVVIGGDAPDGRIESAVDLFVEGDYVADDTTFSALATRITQVNEVSIDGAGSGALPQVIEPPANEADRITFGYVCSGSTLVIDADPAVFSGFPTDFDRVG